MVWGCGVGAVVSVLPALHPLLPVSEITAPEVRPAGIGCRVSFFTMAPLRLAQEVVAGLWAMVSGKRDLPTRLTAFFCGI